MPAEPRYRYPLPPIPEAARFPSAVPWDEPISQLADLWLEVWCDCGNASFLPLRLLSAKLGWKRTLRSILPKLRCSSCKGLPGRVDLIEDPSATAKKGSRARLQMRP